MTQRLLLGLLLFIHEAAGHIHAGGVEAMALVEAMASEQGRVLAAGERDLQH